MDYVDSGVFGPEPEVGWPWIRIFKQYLLGAFTFDDSGQVVRYAKKADSV